VIKLGRLHKVADLGSKTIETLGVIQ
jgi:hypothetical protein